MLTYFWHTKKKYSIATLKTQELLIYQQVGYKFHGLIPKAGTLLVKRRNYEEWFGVLDQFPRVI